MAAMKAAKRKAIEAKGFRVTTVAELLDLTPAQMATVERRVRALLAARLRKKPTPR